jgi:hypothetical protein
MRCNWFRSSMMRRLVCLLRGHQWRIQENYATQGTEQDCQRCGAHRSTFPGDPAFRPAGRPDDGASGEVGGGLGGGFGGGPAGG